MRHYYFAYGMNTHLGQMAQRCPTAEVVGVAELQDYALEFAYHCNVVPAPGQRVPGLLWTITDQDLAALDWTEGYPTYYDRVRVPVVIDELPLNAVVYFMPGKPQPCPPGRGYLDLVRMGYAQNKINSAALDTALNKSYELYTV
jgi:gamma-glutamylcyclotransferase (GGCT)/AIG2-like uncharacterized protein YtfP